MLIYNITFHIEDDILSECLTFLKEKYIPQATRSGFMHAPCMHRIFPHQKGEGANGYAIQLRVKDIDTLNYWIDKEGRTISKQLVNLFGSKVMGFTTILEEMALD